MIKYNAFGIVEDFEEELCRYTGARYAVCVNSCTNALFLCLKYHYNQGVMGIEKASKFGPHYKELTTYIEIPKKTYISVPMQIIHSGYKVQFREENWRGMYQLEPLPIYDSARRFKSGMYYAKTFQCVSFHWSKVLGLSQGGAILHDSPEADRWFRRARFDGRQEGVAPSVDDFPMLGWHLYMSPEIAAHGLVKLMHLPAHNEDLPNDNYPDLSTLELFK